MGSTIWSSSFQTAIELYKVSDTSGFDGPQSWACQSSTAQPQPSDLLSPLPCPCFERLAKEGTVCIRKGDAQQLLAWRQMPMEAMACLAQAAPHIDLRKEPKVLCWSRGRASMWHVHQSLQLILTQPCSPPNLWRSFSFWPHCCTSSSRCWLHAG